MEADDFYFSWTLKLINCLEDNCDEKTCKDLMHNCAEYHYNHNNMDDVLDKYVNDLDGFIQFLTNEWGWIITYDANANRIIADENKADCVCPVVHRAGKEHISTAICHCSEGFAERMFSKVTGSHVKAKVIRSILRGDSSCIYEINLG